MEAESLVLLDNLITQLSTCKPSPTENNSTNKNEAQWALSISVQEIWGNYIGMFWQIFVHRSKWQSIMPAFQPITKKEAVQLITNVRGVSELVDENDNGARTIIGFTVYELQQKFYSKYNCNDNINRNLLYEMAAILGVPHENVKRVIKGIVLYNVATEIVNNDGQFLQHLYDKVLSKYMTIGRMEIFDDEKEPSNKEIWIAVSSMFTENMFNNLVDPLTRFFTELYNNTSISDRNPKIDWYDEVRFATNYKNKIETVCKALQTNKQITDTRIDEKELEPDVSDEKKQDSTVQDVEFDLYSWNFVLLFMPDNSNYGMWVDSIEEKAPLYARDHLKIGVQILSINGIDVTYMTIQDSMEVWKGQCPVKIKYRPVNHPHYVGRNSSESAWSDIHCNAKYHLVKVFGLISMFFHCMVVGVYLDYQYKLMQDYYSYGFYIVNILLICYIWTSVNKKRNILLIISVFIIYGIVQGITIKYTLAYMFEIGQSKDKVNLFDENEIERIDVYQDAFACGMLWMGMFFSCIAFVPFITSQQMWIFLGASLLQLFMVTFVGYGNTMPWWWNMLFVGLCTVSVIRPIQRLLSPKRIFNDDKYQQLDYVTDASNFVADIITQILESQTRRY